MANPAQPTHCMRCQKRLTGSYLAALGAGWHPECWLCARCGKLLKGPFAQEDGRPYHPECHQEAFGQRCSVCGGVLRGAFYQHDGKPVCEKDYLASFAPRCFFCNEVLLGSFRENAHGQKACPNHDHGPTCVSCDRWLGRKESLMAPLAHFGTTLCGGCQADSVGPAELHRYGNAFGSAVLEEMGLSLPALPPVPIRLEPALLVMQLKGSLERQVDGLTQTTVASTNGREAERYIQGIIVIGGLAREHFEGTLAHEFGHVWLFHEKYDRLPPLHAEGFCELVKDVWLERLGTPLAKNLQRKVEASTDPVYGDGFRLLKGQWTRGGLRAVLELLGPGRAPAPFSIMI